MPITKLSMIEGRTIEEKNAVIECVHNALVDAFKIPEEDKDFRICEYRKENYILSPEKTDKYVLVEIAIFPGRSLEAKKLLYRKIVDNLKNIGLDEKDVFVILFEESLENWGIKGGYPASEIDLGFNIQV